MHFPIKLCGAEDNVENYQSYLISCCAGIVFESYEIHVFRFVIRISISRMIFMLKYAFTHICLLRIITSLGCRKCLIGAVHVILKVCEEDAMNDAIFAPSSSKQVDRHIKQNVIVLQS